MLAKRLIPIFLFILIAKDVLTERRIANGTRAKRDVRYMVYIVESERSEKSYDYWLCGGALVSPRHVITAAACLLETNYLYVIAGYSKYVEPNQLELNECTRTRKQRIVKICTPQNYTFGYEATSDWTKIDIGIAFVENPYNFSDITYRHQCSYLPTYIEVNYNPRNQIEGTDAVAFGWGHEKKLRKPWERSDQNSRELNEISVLVTNKTYCTSRFKGPGMAEIINKYMLCCNERGNIQSDGQLFNIGDVQRTECRNLALRGELSKDCDDDADILENYEINDQSFGDYDLYKDIRRSLSSRKENTTSEIIKAPRKTLQPKIDAPQRVTRRKALCQNDHGGPLVTWEGDTEILIGVAATALHNGQYDCVPPSLFTSTACNSMFIKCVMGNHDSLTRKCNDMMKNEGFFIKETYVDW